MSPPEIVMQTPAAKKLEAEVQRKLAEYSYSTADDVVMAEYVVVMLANAKTPDQITAELSELIGEDMYDPGFTTWLFEEVARQYGVPPASSTSPPSPEARPKFFQPNTTNDLSSHQGRGDRIQTVNDSRDHQANYRGSNKRSSHPTNSNRSAINSHANRVNPGGVFGQAVTGLKRPGPNDILKDSPPHRRPRQDDYSSGPRSLDRSSRDQQWATPIMSDRREHVNGHHAPSNHFPFAQPMAAESAAKSILERVGVAPNTNQPFRNNGFPGGYDNQAPLPFRRSKDQGLDGTSHSLAPTQQQLFYGSPSPYALPLMPPHSFPQPHFNPHHPSNAPTPQLFLANGQPYIPPHPFPIPGSTPQAMYPYPVIQPPLRQSPRLSGSAKAQAASETQPKPTTLNMTVPITQSSEPETDPLPSAPLLREECKYNLACKNAWCPSSHCSPKGHPKTSMLLSFYPCELQLQCVDPECLKAHVSPQQADPKSSIKVIKTNAPKATNISQVDTPSNRLTNMTSSINNKPIPCRFGSQCTRSDCVFSHPWIVNEQVNNFTGSISTEKDSNITASAMKNNFSTIPCKFGLQCARPDCFYQHPTTRRLASKNISKTFNNSSFIGGGTTASADVISTGPIVGGNLTGLNSTEKLSPSKKFSPTKPETNSNGNGAHHSDANESNGSQADQPNDQNKSESKHNEQDTTGRDSKVKLVSDKDLNGTTGNFPDDNKNNLSNTHDPDNNTVTSTTFKPSSAPIPAGV